MSNKFIENICSVKNEGNHKIFTLCGLKIKFQKKINIKLLKSEINSLNTEIKSCISNNVEHINNQSVNLTNNIEGKLNILEDHMVAHKMTEYFCRLDPKDYWWKKENFDFFKDFENLQKKYSNLVKGLDKESIELVSRIISRIQRFVLEGKVDFYLTEDEITERRIYDRFCDEFIQLADGNYSRKGYILPQKDMEISVLEYRHGLNYFKHPERFQNKDIIDVGGYIGDSALIFSEITDKKVYTFEPVKEEYEMLLKTIDLNQKNNIIPMNIALGAEEKEEVIKCNHLGASIECVSNYTLPDIPVEDIKVSTLDKYVKDNNLQVGLIKVDIEGYEQEFIKGALETIKTQRPALILSIYHNAPDFFDIKPFIESLNLGYKFRIHKPFDYTLMAETILICEVEE